MDFRIDPLAAEPPFEQVRTQIAAGASTGALPAGRRLPTVRQLAADLGLAVNTVAKAYRALEDDGVIETRGRQGSFIAARQGNDADADAAASTYVAVARRQGLTLDEATHLVQRNWR